MPSVVVISSSFASPPVRFRLRFPVFRRQPNRLSSVHRGRIARMPSPRTSAASSGVIGPRLWKASSTRSRRVSTREESAVAASSLVSSSRWPGVAGYIRKPPCLRFPIAEPSRQQSLGRFCFVPSIELLMVASCVSCFLCHLRFAMA